MTDEGVNDFDVIVISSSDEIIEDDMLDFMNWIHFFDELYENDQI